MAIDVSDYGQLSAHELRQRLEEAEETLRAIREGEVDALMVRNPRSEDEVFTLEGDASYYAFMEAMDLGAAAFDESNRLLYANKALRELLRLPEDNVDASHLSNALDEEARFLVSGLMKEARSAKKTGEIRVFVGKDELHLLVTAAPLHIGANRGLAVTFTDITAKVRAAAAEASERAAHSIIASANEAVVVCDVDGVVTHANAAVASIYAGNPVGRVFGEVIPLTLPDTTGLLQASDVIALAIAGTSVQGIEALAPDAPRVRDLLLSAAPLRVGSDKVSGCVITMVDLSQRKAAEKQQLLLMGELDHRVKNTLALVLSICKRTASTEETVQGFQVAFSGRIQALAATHNLLADRSWSSISIAEVVNAELDPFVSRNQTRLSVGGLDALVMPRAAIALGLVIHELATNAVKYGALSREGGRVHVLVSKKPDDAFLGIEWVESGGPTVSPPSKRGFGQTVITRSLQYSANGGAEIDYPAEGVRCRIRIPEEDLVRS
ncbi:PAS domain S-box protein [Neorhizobium lilium]|uniref:Blue-light-activated histidine kinase n=1 Tax=Neorhizobium lilium TaxID=2503024 RepID=A0A444LDP9_9HYPH|nr:HWE histidine kinase domain-containing protein [Neorhizobium lilium]RWX75929.1 PAS domain S-box protein [Neorhizobium lilium]